jgi:hypothetical protein
VLAIQTLCWAARIWSAASLAFIVLLALGSGGVPTATQAVGFVFFPIGMAVGFVIAWRHEGIGGAIAILSMAAFYLWHFILTGRPPHSPYFLLLAVPGALFVLTWLLRQLQRTKRTTDG